MRKSYDFALSHDFLIYFKLGSYHFQNSRHSCFIFSIFFLRGQLFHIFHILPERSRSCPVNELPITMHVGLPIERFGNLSLQGNENPPRQTWGIWGGPAGGGILGMCFGYLGIGRGGGLEILGYGDFQLLPAPLLSLNSWNQSGARYLIHGIRYLVTDHIQVWRTHDICH